MYQFSPDELGAPTAENKKSLFDWQLENAGGATIEQFGGIQHILETLGTSAEKVSNFMCMHLWNNSNLFVGFNNRTSK